MNKSSSRETAAASETWYFRLPGNPKQGPVSRAEIIHRARRGALTPRHLVRNGNAGDWEIAESIAWLSFPPTAQEPATAKPQLQSPEPAVRLSASQQRPWRVVITAVLLVGSALSIDRFFFRNPSDRTPADPMHTQSTLPTADATKQKIARANNTPEPATPASLAVNTEETDRQMIARVKQSVVTVHATGGEGDSSGSGFFIGDSKTIATNFHVVEGATEITIELPDRTQLKSSGFTRAIPEFDIALITLATSVPQIRPLELATAEPEQGERVFAFGSPKGLTNTVSDGIVSAVRTGAELKTFLSQSDVGSSPACRWVQVTVPISNGSSGGPLVDSRGRVNGVNSMGLRSSQNLNLAVAASIVKHAINTRHEVKPFKELPFIPLPIRGTDDRSLFISGIRHDVREISRGLGHPWKIAEGKVGVYDMSFAVPTRWKQVGGEAKMSTSTGPYSMLIQVRSAERSDIPAAADISSELLTRERRAVELLCTGNPLSLANAELFGAPCTKATYFCLLSRANRLEMHRRYAVVIKGRVVYMEFQTSGPIPDEQHIADSFGLAEPLFDAIFGGLTVSP
jgi:S1-C subfamily serine protease